MINVNNVKIETKNCNLWIEKKAGISIYVTTSITPEENEYIITNGIDQDKILIEKLYKKIYGEIQYLINRIHKEVMCRINIQDYCSIQIFDELFEDLTELISYK